MKNNNILNEDWEILSTFFPVGWNDQAKKLGAFSRARNIKSSNVLLQILLIHLVEGCSLRETVTRAKQGNLADISDVALLKRLKSSSDWLRWMSLEMLKQQEVNLFCPSWLKDYNVKSVDASVITEMGSTGTDWRLHYCYNLFDLHCKDFTITDPKTGESFVNYKVNKKDLFIGDRAYGRLKGLLYIKKYDGEFIARFKNKAFTLLYKDVEFDIVKELSVLKYGEIGEWKVEGTTQKGLKLPIRLCVIKKSKEEAEISVKKAKRNASKKQIKISQETLELHKYVILLTSLPDEINVKLILELYRLRWQIEIAFKRLKSIMGLGHLPKKDPDSCQAWLHGKMFIALLVQSIVDQGRKFSPWGYTIR